MLTLRASVLPNYARRCSVMLDRFLSILMALSLAFLVWLYARSRDQEMLDNIPIPVLITIVPAQADLYNLEVSGPSQVLASFTGPPARIREVRGMLHRGELQVSQKIAVPEERQKESRYTDTVHIEVADLHAPPGVTTTLVDGRNRIPVTLHRLVDRHLSVRFDYTADERLGPVKFEPVKVVVRGPQEILDRMRTMPTQPFVIPAPPEGIPPAQPITLTPVSLVRELEGLPVRATPAEVVPRFTLQPQQKLYEMDMPVRFLCPANWPLRPRFVSAGRDGMVKITIPGPLVEEPVTAGAYIDLTRQEYNPGRKSAPVQVQLPRDFHTIEISPRELSFELVPIDPAAKALEIGPAN